MNKDLLSPSPGPAAIRPSGSKTNGQKTKAGSDQNLRLNIVVFEMPDKPISCGFYTNPTYYRGNQSQLVELPTYMLPAEYDPGDGKDKKPLYTDFTEREDAPLNLTISPKDNPGFMTAWLTHTFIHYFKGFKLMVNHNFTGQPEVWIKMKNQPEEAQDKFSRFERFSLKASVGRYTGSAPELRIAYKGVSDVLHLNMEHYNGSPEYIKWVIDDTPERRKYEDLAGGDGARMKSCYPVLNRSIRALYNLPDNRYRISKKMEHDSSKIRRFYQKYVDIKKFHAKTGLKIKGFLCPDEKDIGYVDIENQRMVFGGDQTETDIYRGLKSFGPYRSATSTRPKLLLIAPEAELKLIKSRLLEPLLKGKNHFPGFRKLTGTHLEVMADPILYSNTEDPYPEIQLGLEKRKTEIRNHCVALYCSPYGKFESDAEKHAIYYRVKELLLRYRVSSQAIDIRKLKETPGNSLSYWLPNLTVALLAKMGGIPWKMAGDASEKPALVIGIGAFKPKWSPNRYAGSSFCFDNTGMFRGFDCFDTRDTRLLAGSIQKALQKYIREYGKAEQIVIHYYKEMSGKEEKPVRDMINRFTPGIPVYLVRINKTMRSEEMGIDLNRNDRLPVSGTYIHLGRDRYLLFNNTRLNPEDPDAKKQPFPVKLSMREIWSKEKKEQLGKLPLEEREFEYLDPDTVNQLMVQVVRFSNMYWKSISPQPLPVTIRFPELLARLVPYFDSKSLPYFGRKNLFFL